MEEPPEEGARAAAPVSLDPIGPLEMRESDASRAARRARKARIARRRLVVVVLIFVVAFTGVAVAALSLGHGGAFESSTTTTTFGPTTTTLSAQQKLFLLQDRKVRQAEALVGITLPAYGKPAPSLPAAGPAHPLPSHQVFGFLPYWSLGDPTQVPYSDLTTVAYFSLDVAKDGSVVEQGQAYDDLSGYDFSSLMQGAHAAGVRVLLTISDATSSTLSAICSRPGVSAANMTAGIEHLIETYGFDGVDIDLEGRATADRERFAELVGLVADKLHAVDASWDVAVDTYPQSAGDPTDFFDVAKIAPHVDQVFVMDYDAENMQVPSPTAPLNASGLSDVATLQAYSSVVPPGKLILGVPFYGVDWTVGKSGQPGSADGPVALTYDQITGAGATPLFDPATDTVFIHYDANGKHHFAWFDDPLTLTLKAALASVYHVAGVGIWALGMQGPNPSLVSALLGGSSPVRLPLAHQPS